VSEQIKCAHCRKGLITIEPGRLTTHGPTSIRIGASNGRAWVECPACGHETPVEPHRLASRWTEEAPEFHRPAPGLGPH
jgi:hypothetical protein